MDIFIDSLFEGFYQQYPLVLVDVGAAGGLPDRWHLVNKHLNAIGFEPDEREFKKLKKQGHDNIRYQNMGILDKQDKVNLYLTKKPHCSSVFPPNTEFLNEFPNPERFDIVSPTKISVDKLDSQLERINCQDVDFIKVDTQGSELFILEGASSILENAVFGLEVEVEFASMYKSQPLFSDVDIFLRKFGFQLFDLKRYYWKRTIGQSTFGKGQIIYADALYLKKYEQFETCLSQKGDKQKAKVLKAISICLLYGYYDYALAICERAHSKNIFTDSEKKIIFTSIFNQSGMYKSLPNFIASLSRRLYKYLRTDKWLYSDDNLGNYNGR
jgi:FkbM family methyltransferase